MKLSISIKFLVVLVLFLNIVSSDQSSLQNEPTPEWIVKTMPHLGIEDVPNSSAQPTVMYVHNLILQTNYISTPDANSFSLGSSPDANFSVPSNDNSDTQVINENNSPTTSAQTTESIESTSDANSFSLGSSPDANFSVPSSNNSDTQVINENDSPTTSAQTTESIRSITTESSPVITTTTEHPFMDEPEVTTTEAPPVPHRKIQVNGFNPIYLPTRGEMTDWTSRANKMLLGSSRLLLSSNRRRSHRRRRPEHNT